MTEISTIADLTRVALEDVCEQILEQGRRQGYSEHALGNGVLMGLMAVVINTAVGNLPRGNWSEAQAWLHRAIQKGFATASFLDEPCEGTG